MVYQIKVIGIKWTIKLLIIFSYVIRRTDGQCNQDSNGLFRYGPGCGYLCHCLNSGEQCDTVSGECTSGCDWNWGGPGCQYRNLALKQWTQHLDNVGQLYADRANDMNIATCSETALPSAAPSRKMSPWWRTWFSQNQTFTTLTIVTKGDVANLEYFKRFSVTVEYLPDGQGERGYFPEYREVCYTHSDNAPRTNKIDVVCHKPAVGNQLTIQLDSKASQLVLCDVRIFTGRNLAFSRNSTQSTVDGKQVSSFAVDGVYSNASDKCSASDWLTSQWWSVDLGFTAAVEKIIIYKHTDDRLRNYILLASNNNKSWFTIHNNTQYEVSTNIMSNVVARYFSVGLPNNNRLVVCEFEVIGDCLDNLCGLDCSQLCHCKDMSLHDKVSGICSSGCTGRWTGSGGKCDRECPSNTWGEQCQFGCGNCFNWEMCEAGNGHCPSGCINGYQPPTCLIACVDGTYGKGCAFTCSGNCLYGAVCSKEDGRCLQGCSPGYIGDTCNQGCDSGFYGDHCLQRCSENCQYGNQHCGHVDGACTYGCNAGWTTPQCDQKCMSEKWGMNCAETCGHCSEGSICRHTDGRCENGCSAGVYISNLCNTECGNGYFGDDCLQTCSKNCIDVCNKTSGSCNQCKPGWKGYNCTTECEYGEWGHDCSNRCGNCFGGASCDTLYGRCSSGCMAGYQNTKMCDSECPAGTYGFNCAGRCSFNCDPPEVCHANNGSCINCQAGWKGPLCDIECDDEHYGQDCEEACGGCVDDMACDKVNGTCMGGCRSGYKVSLLCNEECDERSYGYNCSMKCGQCRNGEHCDRNNGTCLIGCADGFTGHMCAEALELPAPKTVVPVPGIIGGIVGALVAAVIIIIGFVLIRRKHTRKQASRKMSFDNAANEQTVAESMNDKTYANVYINSTELLANRQEKQGSEKHMYANHSVESRQSVIEITAQSVAENTRESKSNSSKPLEEDVSDVYYNEGQIAKRTPGHAIKISDFATYVKSGLSNKDFYVDEFKKIPQGSVHPTIIARKPENAGKNRYKEMYAYDHTRVILHKLPDNPDSDYINASHIRGHSGDKSYIAAQGPTKFIVGDFWRMIWENDVHTIVMVTNLVEETKTKCIKYWAEVDETVEFNSIHVHTEKEDVFAEYTVRNFKVTHQGKSGERRNVTQYHYTAWPDKDIPKTTSSLIHFWRKVRQSDERKSHSWLVHCSAGVGRTGTFIAIDVLYDQGNDYGSLDVNQCVRDLRDQRVNMVQTKEQYKYLHRVMAEIFTLPSKPVITEDFPAVYKDLNETNPNTGKTNLQMEFETLQDETLDRTEESNCGSAGVQNDDGEYSSAKLVENRSKNRYDDILASNEYRPFLFTHVERCTNYINAVYIPSYCDLHGFIVTQTSMPNTVVDLYRLMFEQDVRVVVTFEDNKEQEVGICFPDEGSVTSGPYIMTFSSEESKENFIMRTYNFTHTVNQTDQEKVLSQIVFRHWAANATTPLDAYKMYSFLQDLENLQRQHENKPVIVQCLNGAERSGLVVVLMNILERARFDGEVSIPQVIRQIRNRRQQIIPNFEQYKFCYEVFLCYADTSATYANI